MEFWEDSTDKLAAQFRILILKTFSFLRRFWVYRVNIVIIITIIKIILFYIAHIQFCARRFTKRLRIN